VSLEELLREEVQKQIDKAIEDIPWTTTRLSTSKAKLALQYEEIQISYMGMSMAALFQIVYHIIKAKLPWGWPQERNLGKRPR
jgi:hypothetical protein